VAKNGEIIMGENIIRQHPVASYFALTFLISWGGLIILEGPSGIIRNLSQTTNSPMFLLLVAETLTGPILAAILMAFYLGGKQGLHDMFSSFLKRKVGARWYAVAVLAAPLTVFGTLFALSIISPAFVPGILTASDKISLVALALAVSLIGPFCEEIGWTGFAIPRMRKRHSLIATGITVGILWGAWHGLGNLFGAATSAGTFPLLLFMPIILFSFLPPFRVLMVWVYDHTESLFMAYVMHSSLDFFWLISTPTGIAGADLVTWYIAWALILWVIAAGVVLNTKRAQ
jgi:membrane protease YdiL (CAAX protease family)